jgi:mxaJ protein
MSSHFRLLLLCVLIFRLVNARAEERQDQPAAKQILRIAADPNNLPFSNDRLEGFENKIAEILAKELNANIEYTWRAQRRGFFRETLKAGNTDLVLGVPKHFERALTTEPYYRSSYVFVSRKSDRLAIRSFDDPALRTKRIGVQLIGDDGVNTPPAHALADRNIITNVVGFTLYGNYAEESPPARIIEAVAKKDIDVAIVWGPLAGYFGNRQAVPLAIVPVSAEAGTGASQFGFEISLGVRKKDKELRDRLNEVMKRKHSEIDKILDEFGVPRIEEKKTSLHGEKWEEGKSN